MLGNAAQPILRAIGRIVGSDLLADSVAFFQAFSGMESGFIERADDVVALIRSEATSFVVVASPRHDTIDEAARVGLPVVDLAISPITGGKGNVEFLGHLRPADILDPVHDASKET